MKQKELVVTCFKGRLRPDFNKKIPLGSHWIFFYIIYNSFMESSV